jgi:TolA-binding protein
MNKLIYCGLLLIFCGENCYGIAHASRIGRDSVELEEEVRRINGKVEELEMKLAEQRKEIAFLKEAVAKKAEEAPAVSKEEPDLCAGKTPDEIVKLSSEMIDDNNLEDARNMLYACLKKYPGDIYCGMVHFYLGNSFFVEKNYQKAAFEYIESYKVNRNSSKSAEALYKLALCFKRLSKKSEAKSTLEKLIQDYPNAEITKKAKKEFAKLK